MDKIPPKLFSIVRKKEVNNIGKLFDGQQQNKSQNNPNFLQYYTIIH
jgi:hypothetical protein